MKIPPPITATVASIGPNARAILAGCCNRCGDFAELRKYIDDGLGANWRLCASCMGAANRSAVPPSPLSQRILGVVRDAVQRRRQPCYGVSMTDEQAEEMARGVATSLICSFEITDGE